MRGNFSTEEIAVYPEYDGLREALVQNLLETGSPRVPEGHPAARYRGAFSDGANAADATRRAPFEPARAASF